MTFTILIWHSNWGQIWHIDITVLFWHSNLGRISYFDIHNPILRFNTKPCIVFWHSKSHFDIRNKAECRICTLISYYHIQNEAEYRILTFKILFWHSNWGLISYFDVQYLILSFDTKSNIVCRHSNDILTFELRPNMVFWHSQSYFDIRHEAEYRNIVFWHSKSHFDIRNKAECRICTLISYHKIQKEAKYRILTFKILFWHSNWGRISYFDVHILFCHSTRSRIWYLDIQSTFWHLNLGGISYFDIQYFLTFKIRPHIVIWRSTS